MATLTVSVIVVSRGRPDSLTLTLAGLSRLAFDGFEIVIVTNAEGQTAVQRSGLADRVKLVAFDDDNISAARNSGIAAAAGEIIAFIDDDAVPEPTWLTHLTAPFQTPEVSAVGGFVIGRNGISFQWKASTVDETGTSTPLEVDENRISTPRPPAGGAIRTEGTNMAFRRAVLAELGGFDPAYRFYLDETDIDMRLAKAGHVTAIAPLAQVHHAFAPSIRRAPSRAPRDLFEIGASLAVFLRRHCPPARHAEVITRFRADRNAALITHMNIGRLEPGAVLRLRRRLKQGIKAGQDRDLTTLSPLGPANAPFKSFDSLTTDVGVVLSGKTRQGHTLRSEAAARAARGENVTLFLFSPTALFHRVRFRPEGFWEQSGGLWGRSNRNDPLVRLMTAKKRLRSEMDRLASTRGITVKKT